jgi:hypothetical protein
VGDQIEGIEKRIKETNNIPFKDGLTYIWSVKPNFIRETPVQIKIAFPSRPKNIPAEGIFDIKDNSVLLPLGYFKKEVVLKMKVDEGDPAGLYQMYLIADGTIFAGISYSITKEQH